MRQPNSRCGGRDPAGFRIVNARRNDTLVQATFVVVVALGRAAELQIVNAIFRYTAMSQWP
jgi:hypothetical protein